LTRRSHPDCRAINYLAHRAGDATNAVLAAAGYNFRLLIRWLRFLLCRMLCDLMAEFQMNIA
jgi:IS5 family transposase